MGVVLHVDESDAGWLPINAAIGGSTALLVRLLRRAPRAARRTTVGRADGTVMQRLGLSQRRPLLHLTLTTFWAAT